MPWAYLTNKPHANGDTSVAPVVAIIIGVALLFAAVAYLTGRADRGSRALSTQGGDAVAIDAAGGESTSEDLHKAA